jgi:hypothetical protein
MRFRLLQQLMHWPETLTADQLKWISNWSWDQWYTTGERVQLYSDIYQLADDEHVRRWYERAYERPFAVHTLADRLDRSKVLEYDRYWPNPRGW